MLKILNNNRICLVVIFFSIKIYSQDSLPKATFAPSFNLYVGYIPKTYPIAPKTNYAALASLGIMWQFNGLDKWHQLYRYPKAGFELFFSDFGNPTELGYNVGFVPTLQLTNRKPKVKLIGKYGFGISYFNKPYNPISNTKNFYIGTNLTYMVTLNFLKEKKLNKNLLFTYGLSVVHGSNGHTQLPNVGINLFTAQAGIRFNKSQGTYTQQLIPQKNKLSYAVKLGLGMHEFGSTEKAIGGPKYPSYHLSLWANKPFKYIHTWQAGLTLAYYTSFYDYITSQQTYTVNQKLKAFTAIAFVGHEFIFGKFSVCAQLGLYLYNPFFIKQKQLEGSWNIFSEKIEAFSTNRFGLLYYPLKKRNTLNKLNNQLQLGAFIKANLAQADVFEYSVGWVF